MKTIWKVVLIIVILVALYLVFAYFTKRWPFNPKPVSKPSSGKGKDNAGWLRANLDYARKHAKDAGIPDKYKLPGINKDVDRKGAYSKEELQKINDYLAANGMSLIDKNAFDWLDAIFKDVISGKTESPEKYFEWLENQ